MTAKFSKKRILFSYTGWWLVWIAIQTHVLIQMGLAPGLAVTDSAVTNIMLALSGILMYNTLRFYRPSGNSLMYLRLWALLLAVILTFVFNGVMRHLVFSDEAYIDFLHQSFSLRFCYNLLTIAILTLLSWIAYYFKEQQEGEQRKSDADKLAREAELSKLRQQLQPHFLFNSLNSINALIGSRPEEARRMIQQLSDFLRGTLRKDEQQLVPLAEELKHLQLYLEIEKVRFGHRLHTVIEHDAGSLQLMLPSLLLQPLVENAIKFGLYDTTGEVTIHITAKQTDGVLSVEVRNPFDAETSKPLQGTGFGLSSVQRRLYLLFARNDLLQTSQAGKEFITTVQIPQTL